MPSLLSELRRRSIFKVAAAYALVAWILIEAGSVLLPTFGAPQSFFRVYVLLVMGGFVLSLVFAWVYEITPEGVKREKDLDRSAAVAPATGRRLTFTIIGLLAIALIVSLTLNFTGLRELGKTRGGNATGTSIAVLPFKSFSADQANVLFADGMHDDLLTSLANIRALKVISRTSVMEYRDTLKNLRQIASELGVDTVLEGGVQRFGDSVRINVQLIDAISDEHIWASRYDRELTARNIFAIQSEIAEDIASALKRQLTPEEQGRIGDVPTESLKAYELYTAGRNNLYKRRLETLQLAGEQFRQAIALDPEYADAYSGLADSVLLLMINHNAIAVTDAWAQAQAALDRALALNPHSADAYASLGLLKMNVWQVTHDEQEYGQAEAAFRRAIELRPNHANAYTWYAGLLGGKQNYSEAVRLFRKALELDPLARIARSNLAGIYAQMGRNDAALAEYVQAVRINPDYPNAYNDIANQLAGLGRLDEAYAWAEKARQVSTDPLAGQAGIGVLLEFGDTDKAARRLDPIPSTHPLAPIVDGYQKFFRGQLAAALSSWEAVLAQGAPPHPFLIDAMSDAATMLGDYPKALEYCLQLSPEFNEPAPTINSVNAHNAIKFAFLLQKTGAPQRAAELLQKVEPIIRTLPRLGANGSGIRDVQVLALLGQREAALDRLREAFEDGFNNARFFDSWSLAEDPYLDSLRDSARFRALLDDIAARVAKQKENLRAVEAAGDLETLREIVIRK